MGRSAPASLTKTQIAPSADARPAAVCPASGRAPRRREEAHVPLLDRLPTTRRQRYALAHMFLITEVTARAMAAVVDSRTRAAETRAILERSRHRIWSGWR